MIDADFQRIALEIKHDPSIISAMGRVKEVFEKGEEQGEKNVIADPGNYLSRP